MSYRAITPKQNEACNVLVPVCLSASHIAFGSIRMEPVYMVLGETAALAACQAIDTCNDCVQQVNSFVGKSLMRSLLPAHGSDMPCT